METRLKVIRELCKVYPIQLIIMEDVRYNHYRFRDGKAAGKINRIFMEGGEPAFLP